MKSQNTDRLWLNELSGLNEVQRRRFAALKSIELGWGGVSKVSKLTGMSHHTIDKGIAEVKRSKKRNPDDRLRKPGGGRKKITDKNPTITAKIDAILDENTAGDPMSLLKWTHKSTYAIAEELTSQKCKVSADTVGRLLKKAKYTLQSNNKSKEGKSVEERDSQFKYINQLARQFTERNAPVISVDAKKKELVGNFKNPGRTWLKKGTAEIVNVYDYETLSEGKALPYGVYELVRNNGFVNVGISSNTSEFAAESIRKWWQNIGSKNYSNAKELLVYADAGSNNSSRSRLWKYFLYQFAKQYGLKITVCHYPPGTSKWNKIEHRMFSFISLNWKGKPLRTYEIVLNLIRGTKNRKGLKIFAKLDRKKYQLGKKISDEDFEKITVKHHAVNSDWNYTLN